MKTVVFDLENFRQGFQAKQDTSKTKFGAARIMRNCQISDRGGIQPRPGTKAVGGNATEQSPVVGFYNFKKAFESDEIIMMAFNDKLQVLSKKFPEKGFKTLKNGFTPGKEFGFVNSLVNTTNTDYVVGCNRFDNYFGWDGVICEILEDVADTDTEITVDSVLTDEILWSEESSSSTTTTINIATARWAANQWNNLYVYVPSTGDIRKITATTTNQITFGSISGLTGAVDFEIRKLKFAAETGKVFYNNQELDFTALIKYNKITVSSPHVASSGDLLFSGVEEYPAAPKGNRFANYLSRIVVGRVRSAVAKDEGGTEQGYSTAGSYFFSRIKDPFDFTWDIPRLAGQADIVSTPLGGNDITDVTPFEDTIYIFKEDYIESLAFSADSQDLPQRTPLKDAVGSVGKTIKGTDDIYFFTPDKRFTSIGRAANKDLKPETFNIGDIIQSFLNKLDVSTIGRGIEFRDRFYIPLKSSSSEPHNDIVLIYNKLTKTFEGVWDIFMFGLMEWQDKLIYAESFENHVREIDPTISYDEIDGERFPISVEYATHFFNLTPSKANIQAINGLVVEGYVEEGASMNFEIWQDHNVDQSIFSANVEFDTEKYLDGININAALGSNPLGVGAISSNISQTPGPDGMRHFMIRFYFPHTYGNYFSVGHKTSSSLYKTEVIRYGLMIKDGQVVDTNRIK